MLRGFGIAVLSLLIGPWGSRCEAMLLGFDYTTGPECYAGYRFSTNFNFPPAPEDHGLRWYLAGGPLRGDALGSGSFALDAGLRYCITGFCGVASFDKAASSDTFNAQGFGLEFSFSSKEKDMSDGWRISRSKGALGISQRAFTDSLDGSQRARATRLETRQTELIASAQTLAFSRPGNTWRIRIEGRKSSYSQAPGSQDRAAPISRVPVALDKLDYPGQFANASAYSRGIAQAPEVKEKIRLARRDAGADPAASAGAPGPTEPSA